MDYGQWNPEWRAINYNPLEWARDRRFHVTKKKKFLSTKTTILQYVLMDYREITKEEYEKMVEAFEEYKNAEFEALGITRKDVTDA